MSFSKGFTLVEVLVTSVITGFVLAGLAMTLVFAIKVADDVGMVATLSNMGQLMQTEIINNIRQNSSLSVEEISESNKIVGKKLVIKNRDNLVAYEYAYYNNETSDLNKKNKLFRIHNLTMSEIKPIGAIKYPVHLVVDFSTNGTTYEADLFFTLVYKRNGEDYKKSEVKNIAVACRNYSKL